MTTKNLFMLTDAEFDEKVLNSEHPVLVDFFATWCGPCKTIAPYLEELADEYEGKVKIAKVNVDENPASAAKFGVRSIPTLILFKNGKQEQTIIGADPGKIRDVVASAA